MNRSQFSVLWYLFAFEGRINRAKYWAFVALVFFFVFPALRAVVGLRDAVVALDDPATVRAVETGTALLSLVIFVPLVVSIFAVGAKRWHDRNKSGWWVLLNLVPVIGPIWTLVECGCLKGTEGQNRHGPDPLAPPVETVFE